MGITNIKDPAFSSSNTWALLFPVSVIVGGLLLLIFVAPQSYSQITDRIASYKEQKVYYDNLQKKLSVLQSTSPSILNQTGQIVTILPDKNPILSFISQMKNLAVEKNVVITDIKTDTIADNDVKVLEFEIGVTGDSIDSINALVKDLYHRAPVVTIDEMAISDNGEAKAGKVKMSVYWADLPTSLPALTDPLPPFSPEELKTLDQLRAYQVPDFSTLTPADTLPRDNPFN